MKYKKITDCTLLLITHERPKLLNKSLKYYKNFFTNIKVLDSSLQQNNELKNQCEYYHCKKKSILQKILLGLSKTKTKYTIITPDDDFFFPNSIKTGVSFLNKNLDYVSVSGKFYSFEVIGFLKKFNLMYKNGYNNISDKSPLNRLKKICSEPMTQMTYTLLKTNIVYKSLLQFKLFKQANFLEDTITLTHILFGKHKNLNINWMVRDGSVNTSYTSFNQSTGLFKYKQKKTNYIFKKFLKSYLNLLNKNHLKVNKKLTEKYLKKYFSRSKKVSRTVLGDTIIIKNLKKIYKISWYSIFFFRYWLFFSQNEKKFLNLIFK